MNITMILLLVALVVTLVSAGLSWGQAALNLLQLAVFIVIVALLLR